MSYFGNVASPIGLDILIIFSIVDILSTILLIISLQNQ